MRWIRTNVLSVEVMLFCSVRNVRINFAIDAFEIYIVHLDEELMK